MSEPPEKEPEKEPEEKGGVKKRKVIWPKMDKATRKKRRLDDVVYGAAVHALARYVKNIKGGCPRISEVLAAFSDWAMETADEALHEGRITRAMIESRDLAFRKMSKEQLKACSNWLVYKGPGSVAEVADEALRLAFLEAHVEIVEE